ncbi:unnamed protein product [Ectocarpus sp. CCAP 1310/34]|nr:unnamed protein product [Ectocarpus sp. CCAP 1310/34]
MLEPSENLKNTHTTSKERVRKPEEVHLQSLQHVCVLKLNYTPTHFKSTTAAASPPLSRI